MLSIVIPAFNEEADELTRIFVTCVKKLKARR